MPVTLVYTTGGPANPAVFTGPGTTGRVPNPVTSSGRYLRDDGSWAAPAGAGLGDVSGPDGATNNAVAVYDGTSGTTLKDSGVTINADGDITVPATATVDGRDLSVDGNKLDDIEESATADQNAAEVPFSPATSSLGATNVQAAIDELDAKVEAGGGGGGPGTDDQTAAEVAFTPAGTISATNVQAAIQEVSGDVTTLTSGLVAVASALDVDEAALAAHVGTGGSTHPVAVSSGAAGFLSGADKAKLDGVESGATADQSAVEVPFAPAGTISSTNVQAAVAEVDADRVALSSTVTGHIGTGGAAHPNVVAAGAAGFMTGADKTKLNGVEAGATADQTAAEVPVTPSALITSTNVAAALLEVDERAKLALALGPYTGTISGGTLEVNLGSAVSQGRYVLSADAVVSFAAPAGYTIRAGDETTLEVSGDYTLAWPTTVVGMIGRYDGLVSNLIHVRAIDSYSSAGQRQYIVKVTPKFLPPKTGLVFRQVMPNFFASRVDALDRNIDALTPTSETLFSALARIEEYRRQDNGLFKFRLDWPTLSKSVTWWQASAPQARYEEVDGFELITSTGSPNLTGFGGLSLSAWGGTLLDGIPGVQWGISPFGAGLWFCVGRLTAGDGVGIPQLIPADVGTTTGTVEIHVIS